MTFQKKTMSWFRVYNPQPEAVNDQDRKTFVWFEMSVLNRERLADDKFREILVCVSPTQAKKYAIKPVIP